VKRLFWTAFALIFILAACSPKPQLCKTCGTYHISAAVPDEERTGEMEGANPIVTIQMAGGGIIKIELYPGKAPNTAANFVNLVECGYFNGKNFHRIDPGFMIQGGCPEGTGMGRIGHTIKGEFASNGFANDISHLRGVISMARLGHDPDSAGSQFFICHGNAPRLDGSYAAFGMVIEGMEVVDGLANGPASGDRALEPGVMEKVTVETFGVEYKAEVIQG
jgi:peptidyl-prolyl cis-trans isomerase B (cyclophilin B)